MNHFLNLSNAEIAFQFINSTNKNLFITGKAGSGKTTLLKRIINETFKQVIVAAPTGIAAINAGGVTLHSLFQLPFGGFIPTTGTLTTPPHLQFNNQFTIRRHLKIQGSKRQLLRQMELLVIDEVSMLRADILDAIDHVLQSIRRSKLPFGGVQLLFIGDLYQLPPVVKEDEWHHLQPYYSSMFFFDAVALKGNQPMTLVLDKIYRQSDAEFIGILNRIRNNHPSSEDIAALNKQYRADYEQLMDKEFIMLTTHNNKADRLNQAALQKLSGKSRTYKASVNGDFNEYSYPVDHELHLKTGAQVMMIKNDVSGDQRYYNGKIGKIVNLLHDEIEVAFEGEDETVLVEKYEWENKRFHINTENNEIEEKVIGSFSHFPVKLAWAITIHKSQGLTFEQAIIDVNNAFASGQVYVALSRLTSLKGLVLSARFQPNAMHIDQRIISFSNDVPSKDILFETFQKESVAYIIQLAFSVYDFYGLKTDLGFHLASYNKDKTRSAKQKFKPWAIQLVGDFDAVHDTAIKFLNQLREITRNPDSNILQVLNERIAAARNYFEPLLLQFSKNILAHYEEVNQLPQVKTYLKEINELDALFLQKVYDLRKTEELIYAAIHQSVFDKHKVKGDLFENKKSALAKIRKKRPEKVDSKTISYNFFKEGKSIEEIAEARELVPGTIQSHLVHFVAEGKIEINDVLPDEKFDAIKKVKEHIKSTSATAIKEKLGSEYSYGDIRMALAALRFKENIE